MRLNVVFAYGILLIVVISCVAYLLILSKDTPKRLQWDLAGNSASNESLDKPKNLTSLLPRLNVSMFKNCDAYNELRDVNFVGPVLQNRLCTDSPAYVIINGRFPLCQLNSNLPKHMYEFVNRTSRIATVERATRNDMMSVYTFSDQDFISRQMLQTHHWETGKIREIIDILRKFPTDSVTFMDIGSNLGLYSLQAREEGYPVVAVDANIRTLIRMQMTAKNLGILDDRLKLFWCFLDEEVALKHMNWVALFHDCHIGGAYSGSTDWVFPNPTKDTIPVMTARADDLVGHIKTKKIVIKMDIESGEHMFMRTGSQLFSNFDVLILQMEFWRSPGQPPQTSPFYKYITDFMTSRNFSLISVGSRQVQKISTFNESDGMWVRNDFLKMVAKL